MDLDPAEIASKAYVDDRYQTLLLDVMRRLNETQDTLQAFIRTTETVRLTAQAAADIAAAAKLAAATAKDSAALLDALHGLSTQLAALLDGRRPSVTITRSWPWWRRVTHRTKE